MSAVRSNLCCPKKPKPFSKSSSVSDACIQNRNREFWLRNSEDEAWNLWEMGKALGVSFVGEEKGVIDRLVSLVSRK